MKEVSALLQAISSLLWPIFAFVTLFLFKKQIGDAIGRFKKGKLLGQEFELNDSIKNLHHSANGINGVGAKLYLILLRPHLF